MLRRTRLTRTVPWYVSAFLKLIGPFIDPVTKSKIKYNEPLVDHVPASQLMAASGGEVDFKYDHSIYWPALDKMAAERRQQRRERWEKAGKHTGESEIYLWGGEESSVGAETPQSVEVDTKAPVEAPAAATGEKVDAENKAPAEANGAVTKTGETELVDGVAGLDIKTNEPVKTTT
jgi:hypothetical protein